jgi:hypothetical protein
MQVTLAAAGLIFVAAPALAEELAAEVYRDEDITIHAGVSELPGRIIHFGDVLPLVVDVTYDSDTVSVDELNDDFFTAAWPEGDEPVLVRRTTSRRSGPGRSVERLQTVFRFQILDCPGQQWTCPGTREYLLPEFSLHYRIVDGGTTAGTTESLRFRPWPSVLTVSPAIPLDEEDQLYPFKKYFPTNAYPDPVSGSDRRPESLGFVGIGMAALLGGILMWPFRLKKSSPFAAKSQARWQDLLQELQDDDAADEKRYFDRLRRCFVWYCTDELGMDPFDWMRHAGDGFDEQGDEKLANLRSLFVELLHNPTGQGPELRTRLSDLIALDAHA